MKRKKYDLRMFEDGSMLIEQKVKGKLSCIFDKLVSLFIDWILRPKCVFVKTLGNAVSFFLSIVVVVVNIVPYSFVLSWLLNNNFPLTNFLSLSIVQVPSFKNAIYQIMIKAESGQRSFVFFVKYLVLRTSSWLSFNM